MSSCCFSLNKNLMIGVYIAIPVVVVSFITGLAAAILAGTVAAGTVWSPVLLGIACISAVVTMITMIAIRVLGEYIFYS